MVSVSWYEAAAFAVWFDRQFRKAVGLPEGFRFRLPTASEWQRAAQGGPRILRDAAQHRRRLVELYHPPEIHAHLLQANPFPARDYPWGNAEPEERANWAPTGIDATSTVGCFDAGISPVGAEEMAGNVWEWTESWDDSEKSFCWVCGGSWADGPGFMNATVRSHGHPGHRDRLIGFRLVCGGESC